MYLIFIIYECVNVNKIFYLLFVKFMVEKYKFIKVKGGNELKYNVLKLRLFL